MRKEVLFLFLALALSVGLAVPAAAVESGFADVDPNAYYAEAVAWAVENNITSGTSTTTFSPDNTCTRGQIITFLWRGAGSPEPSVTGGVSDIKESDYFYQAVLWAKEKGVFEGDAFQPNISCTRLMAVRFMWEVAYRPWGLYDMDFSDIGRPEDDDKDTKAVSWAVKWGITAGTSKTTFSPNAVCTRGQIVTFLYRCTQNFQPAGTPLADESRIPGTYVMEGNSRFTIQTELVSTGVRFNILLTASGSSYIAGRLNIIPGEYGGLCAAWNGLEMQFYEGFLILTVPESVSSTCAGKYILQTN